jgi:transcription initiation factor TFIIH subunit 1
MVSVREDVTPLTLEWKAIDQTREINIPLNSLSKLQASKDSSPKMMLKVFYKVDDKEESIKLTFSNRPTMNNIKDSLQTIVARHSTVIKDATPGSGAGSRAGTPSTPSSSGQEGNNLSFSKPDSLSDASLLKNLDLQQKLLVEDRELRNIFTEAVINHKLPISTFWSTRLNQLRTFALTISQHRGPYNVLSTIKPVASSDNQVNVTVTHDTINEIFETYPIIKKAYTELVPLKVDTREFWSRFFNSKLFRRLRGDKINNNNSRGDIVLDKYLYIDQDFVEQEEQASKQQKLNDSSSIKLSVVETKKNLPKVNKFLDLLGNEEDNSQKLGNKPDLTMRFTDEEFLLNNRGSAAPQHKENEMIVLMKNMNKLSSKMISVSDETTTVDSNHSPDALSVAETNEYEEELNLHDLNDVEDLHYIKLHIESNLEIKDQELAAENPTNTTGSSQEIKAYLLQNQFNPSEEGIALTDTYVSKTADIEKTNQEITMLIKQNFRTFRLLSKDQNDDEATNIVPDSVSQEIISFNITIVEFLSHFWKLFLNGNQPERLKEIFKSLKSCQTQLQEYKERKSQEMKGYDTLKDSVKLQDKIVKDFHSCLVPLEIGLDKAITEYVNAVKAFQAQRALENGVNENGKRPLS